MSDQHVDNALVAEKLARVAELLQLQGAGQYRARAYRRAAMAINGLDESVADMLDEGGTVRLKEIRGIGDKLAGAIEEIVRTGRLGLLQRLETEVSPETVFTQLPGIGEQMATRIHDELGIETLEELERAAHDGRLQKIDGIGRRTAEGIKDALAGMLSRSASRRARQRQEEAGAQIPQEPSVDLLLEIDAEYREKAQAGELERIAPRRFNPQGEAWLPIMRTERDGWSFTALFSNTARAHELDKTDDWVVIYYEVGGWEDQCTVVTGTRGSLTGKRVIRGREAECREYYASD